MASALIETQVIYKTPAVRQSLSEFMEKGIGGFWFDTRFQRQINDLSANLILVEFYGEGTAQDIRKIRQVCPASIIVAFSVDEALPALGALRSAGADEALTLDSLYSAMGRRLLERLLELKHLRSLEESLQESEERFRGIIENSHDIVMLLDHDATVVYNSPSFSKQLGYEPWEVLGQNLFSWVHEDDKVTTESVFKIIVAGGAVSLDDAFQFRFRRKDGVWRYMEAAATNLLSNDAVNAVVLNARDITYQKKTEEELEQYQHHLEELVEERTREAEEADRRADTVLSASPDALLAMDPQGYLTFVSRHYAKVYPESFHMFQRGRHVLEVFEAVTREVGLPENDKQYTDMKAWWSRPRGTKEFRLPNGLWLRLQAKPMPKEDGGGIVVTTTNISEYKRQQALLAAQSAALEDALAKEKHVVEQQRAFVAMVSHEFRTPLTIIDGNAQIIQRRGDKIGREALVKRAQTIRSGVDRLIHLIERILSSNMIETGRLTIEPEACDLKEIISVVCSEQQDVSPKYTIDVDVADLPDKVILDPKVTRQVVTNLISNAVKYSPDVPKVEVKAWAEDQDIILTVKDHGVGIPEGERPKMFQKFFRASTSSGIPGSGLGLNLVKQFVELHNGTIDFESVLGQGTTFIIRLPLKKG